MNSNTGHGHVRPRDDGARARCGGPGLCQVCNREKAALTLPAVEAVTGPSDDEIANVMRANSFGVLGPFNYSILAAAGRAVLAAFGSPPGAAPADGFKPVKVTEEMHVAAVKVLHRANGLDGLPQRMLDAMLAAAPTPAAATTDGAAEVAKPVSDNGADDIRAQGWAVAVHNDYRLAGEAHTFWLFTKGDRAAKGEGKTDAEALAQIRESLGLSASQAHGNSEAVAWQIKQMKSTLGWRNASQREYRDAKKSPGAFEVRELFAAAPQPAPAHPDAADAARYRWLRDGRLAEPCFVIWAATENPVPPGEMDFAIDAALQAEKGGNRG